MLKNSFLQTESCVYCERKARYYTGVVFLDEIKISAGFCEEHKEKAEIKAHHGKYYNTMGLKLSPLFKEEDLQERRSLLSTL